MKIGLIAGRGKYPLYLARTLKNSGHQVYGLGILNHVDLELKQYCEAYKTIGLGRLGAALRFFRKHQIAHATMAGKIDKKLLFNPWFLWSQLPDWQTFRLFLPMFLTRKKDCKDDTLMLAIVDAFAKNGITFLPGTHFAPELLVKRQKLTRLGPTSAQWKDVCFGWQLAKEMGRLDIGQSVCVKNQAVLAVEAIEGTDECIRRAGSLCTSGGFTVVKAAKPQQDMRFDVPTFGLKTIQTMLQAGARIFAIEADKTILLDKKEVVDFADLHKIAIVSITEEDTRLEASPFPPGFPAVELFGERI
ncbi:MAG: UDP-2,3-diacylglucosamine diphosphatase LpxI [Planctomycetaceae bacterium]|nr:UDP-2,3-diacylglucosamine diphosphatase LpxI [Planctomycetaceae bacterium]